MDQTPTANTILAMTAKYLRENSSPSSTQLAPPQINNTNDNVGNSGVVPIVTPPTIMPPKVMPVDPRDCSPKRTTSIDSKKDKDPIQKINIKASDKENSKRAFKRLTVNDLSRKLSQKNMLEKQLNEAPEGSNFFYEQYKEYNGCHSAAWKIEESPNNLLKATVLAFAYHVPLRFKPDHILYAILSGFNFWVNEKGGHIKLAQKNLVDESKKNIKIEMNLNPDWDEVVDLLGLRLEEAITNKDLVEIMKASFTTTTQTMMRVKNLTVASIMKKFVKIEFSTMCGIPYVTLEGTPQDWEKVKVVANALLSLADGDLNWWLNKLNEALDVFMRTSNGENTEKEWINFLNFQSHSGSHACDGWINALFPYVKESRYDSINIVQNKVLLPVDPKEKNSFYGIAIDFANYLPSISTETYEWTAYNKPYKTLHVTAGLVDVIQWTGEDYALEPFMGYQIDSSSNK
jgi:hypothetical protein